MINLELTPKIKAWLETDKSKRNLEEGATLLVQVTKNRILYDNIMRRLDRSADIIEYHLKKIYKVRLELQTHEQVAEMMVKVDAIAESHGLNPNKRSEFQRGKRADHDELPPEVQQLYVENADVMRRMRECHTRLRMIDIKNSTCPDSDRYPFAKELIALDIKYRDNWNVYDHYIKGTPVCSTQKAVESRSADLANARVCNLLLGQYANKPSETLADRIKTAYSNTPNPTEALTSKMKAAGLL